MVVRAGNTNTVLGIKISWVLIEVGRFKLGFIEGKGSAFGVRTVDKLLLFPNVEVFLLPQVDL